MTPQDPSQRPGGGTVPSSAVDLSTAARGLTLVNAGLGLALWALVWLVLGGPPRAIALVGTCAGFVMVIGFIHGAFLPGDLPAALLAGISAGATFVNVLAHLFAFAQKSEPAATLRLILLGLAAVSYVAYLLLLILMLRRCFNATPLSSAAGERGRGEGDAAPDMLLHWFAALFLLLAVVAVGWIVPALVSFEAEGAFITAAAVVQVLFIAALSSLMLRLRRWLRTGPKV